MREYKTSDVYQVFCNQFQNAELSAALQAELVRAKQVNQNSTLFRELAGRPKGSGAWFSWASAEPLEVSLLREMAEEERLAMVFALADVPIVGLPPERIHREAEERCVLFLREGMAAAAPDPLIRKLEPKDLPLLDGLFDHPDITQAQRAVYRGAYEVIISAEDAPDFAGAVYGLLEEGQLLAAIQITTQSYASLHFRQNAMINPFTRPDQRRRGHGAALMNHVLGLFPGEQVKYEYDGENESAQELVDHAI